MPTPNEGETRKKYVSRCISYLFHHEGETDKSQAAAKCHGMYDQWLKRKRGKRTQAMGERDIDFRQDPRNNPLLEDDAE